MEEWLFAQGGWLLDRAAAHARARGVADPEQAWGDTWRDAVGRIARLLARALHAKAVPAGVPTGAVLTAPRVADPVLPLVELADSPDQFIGALHALRSAFLDLMGEPAARSFGGRRLTPGVEEFFDRLELAAAANVPGALFAVESGAAHAAGEARFRTLIEHLPGAVWEIDTQGVFTYVSPQTRELLGYEPGELEGRLFLDLIAPPDAALARATMGHLLVVHERLEGLELRLLRRDGVEVVLESNAGPHFAPSGELLGYMGVSRDVTRRREAEAALADSEERLRLAMAGARAGAWEWRLPAGEALWSEENYAVLGLASAEESPSYERWLECVHPEDRPFADSYVQRAFGQGTNLDFEYRVVWPDGSVRWLRAMGEPVRDAQGHPERVVGINLDITEQKTAEEALREGERRYRAIVDDQTELICRFRADGTLTFVNQAYAAYFGKRPEELVGHSFFPLISPEDQARVQSVIARLSRSRPTHTHEHRVVTAAGETRWQQWTNRALCNGEDVVLEYQAVGRDVTELKRAEEALRESQGRLELALSGGEVGLWDWDIATGELHFDSAQRWAEFLGYEPGEIEPTAAAWWSLLHPEDGPLVLAAMEAHARSETATCEAECRLRGRSGEWRWALIQGKIFAWDEDDNPVRAAGTYRDITAGRRAEQELEENRKLSRTLLDASADPAMLLDANGLILEINEAGCRILGKSVEELRGAVLWDHMVPERVEPRLARLREVIYSGQPGHFRDLDTPGKEFYVTAYPVFDRLGYLHKVAVFTHDMSEVRQAEEMAVRSQRMAAIGQLAGGVAHEFNNLLFTVSAHGQLAELRRKPEQLEKLIEVVSTAAARGSQICLNLMSFAQPQQPDRFLAPVTVPLEGALLLVERELRHGAIEVVRRWRPDQPVLEVDTGQLEQVFLNVLLNAREAMPDGGTVTIEVTTRAGDEGEDWVEARVTDTGTGIRPEDLSRVFEPFFTTKGLLGRGAGHNTGLGLSISRGLVEANRGRIAIAGAPGRGTTVTVAFPASQKDGGAPWSAPSPPAASSRSASERLRVLVVDDEPSLVEALTELLSWVGHEVQSAPEGNRGLELALSEDFDVVLLDLVMPGVSGEEVLTHLRAARPGLPVVLLTGKGEPSLEEHYLRRGAAGVLRKPVSLENLTRALARAARPAPAPSGE